MKPIHIITEDCKECSIKGLIEIKVLPCNYCNNKGKTNKLIFKIEDFEKCYTSIHHPIQFCSCKGIGYILSKKGETKEIYEDFKIPENLKGNNKDFIRNYGDHFVWNKWNNNGIYRVRQFHLTKDAEVKSVGTDIDDQFYNLITSDIKYPLLIDFMEKHNLSDNSKIVICEGYYVN